jgi:hypothetical protein
VGAYDIYRQVDIYGGEAVCSFFHMASMRGLWRLGAAGLKLGTVDRTTWLAPPLGLWDLSAFWRGTVRARRTTLKRFKPSRSRTLVLDLACDVSDGPARGGAGIVAVRLVCQFQIGGHYTGA